MIAIFIEFNGGTQSSLFCPVCERQNLSLTSGVPRPVRKGARPLCCSTSQFGNLSTAARLNLDRIPSPCYRGTFLLPAPKRSRSCERGGRAMDLAQHKMPPPPLRVRRPRPGWKRGVLVPSQGCAPARFLLARIVHPGLPGRRSLGGRSLGSGVKNAHESALPLALVHPREVFAFSF